MKCPFCDNKLVLKVSKKEGTCVGCHARYVIEGEYITIYYFPTMARQKLKKGDLKDDTSI